VGAFELFGEGEEFAIGAVAGVNGQYFIGSKHQPYY